MKIILQSIFLAFVLILTTHTIHAQWQQTAKINSGNVRCIVFKDTTLYVGTYGHGIFASNNNGASWDSLNNGISNPYIRSLSINGQNIYAGTVGGGVFKSSDNGLSWTKVNSGLKDTVILTLSFDNILLFAGSLQQGIFKSTDDGNSWTQSNNGLTNTTINVLTSIDTNIYAGTWGGGIFFSSDRGENWNGIFNDSLKNRYISGVAAVDTNLFIGTLSGRIYQNYPHLSGWIAQNTGLTASIIYSLYSNNGTLFTGTDQGIYAILKGTSSWVSENGNLPANVIRAIVANGSYLYIGTDNGVWFRSLSDFNPPTYIADDHAEIPTRFKLEQNYPNPFNPSTIISYSISQSGPVTLKVYDLLGREVQTLVQKDLSPGTYKTEFNSGNLASGVYLYRLQSGSYAVTKKMILMR